LELSNESYLDFMTMLARKLYKKPFRLIITEKSEDKSDNPLVIHMTRAVVKRLPKFALFYEFWNRILHLIAQKNLTPAFPILSKKNYMVRYIVYGMLAESMSRKILGEKSPRIFEHYVKCFEECIVRSRNYYMKLVDEITYNSLYGEKFRIPDKFVPYYNAIKEVLNADVNVKIKAALLAYILDELFMMFGNLPELYRLFWYNTHWRFYNMFSRNFSDLKQALQELGEDFFNKLRKEFEQNLRSRLTPAPYIVRKILEELKKRGMLGNEKEKLKALLQRGGGVGMGTLKVIDKEEPLQPRYKIEKILATVELDESRDVPDYEYTIWRCGDPPSELDLPKTFTRYPVIPGYNTVRRKKRKRKITVLLDLSGSMAGYEYHLVRMLASLIKNEKPSEISIIGFGEYSRYIVKPTQNLYYALERIQGIYTHGGTMFTPAFRLVDKEVKKEILVVISDGKIHDMEVFSRNKDVHRIIRSFQKIYLFITPQHSKEFIKQFKKIRGDVEVRPLCPSNRSIAPYK